MSRTEKYLPFILAFIMPVMSSLNYDGPKPHGFEAHQIIQKYLEIVTFLLGLWFLNKQLFFVKRRKFLLPTRLVGILVNGGVILLVLAIDYYLLPNGLTNDVPIPMLAFRISLATLIFTLILRTMATYKERSNLKIQNLELQSENLKFQMELMKQQINPHFLFNSLNTLLDLVEEDQKAASSYVKSFSRLYRVVLQSSKHDFVPLGDELKFLSDYWNLLKVRFNDSIELNIDIDEDKANSLIPPLSLQFLVENAVKHNEANKNKPLVISINETMEGLEVRNELIPKLSMVQSEKMGLKNLQQRFSRLHQPLDYGIEGNDYVVKIPLKNE